MKLTSIRPATLLAGLLLAAPLPAAFDSADAPAQGDVHVVRVTPEGSDVPAGRQVVVRFDRPMRPLGQMRVRSEDSPVRITPALACDWHWLDTRSFACELNAADALVPATRYELTVRAGLVAEDGNVLRVQLRASFTTERPAIRAYEFQSWRGPGTPVIKVLFNQPVTRDSVSEHLHFSGRARVLVEPAAYDREAYQVFFLPGEKRVLVLPVARPPPGAGVALEARRLWLVSPALPLPGDAVASLEVEPGISGYAGPLRGVERRSVVDFDTFPEFRFLGVRCSADGHRVLLAPDTAGVARCNPLATVALVFSAPLIAAEIRDHLRLEPELAGGRTDYDPWANVYPSSSLSAPYRRSATYEVPLPEPLLAFRDYTLSGLGAVRDEFGRAPRGPTAMHFATDHRPPRLRLTSHVAVLEKDAASALPLYVTNLTDLEIHYGRLTAAGSERQLTRAQPLTRAWDVAYAAPLPLRELLGGRSGVVSGTLTPHPTPPVRERGAYFDEDEGWDGGAGGDWRFFAQVTPFAVHVKLGHYNTLVWVTTLARGLPVAGARVTVYQESDGLTAAPEALAEARTDAAGIALLPGRETLDPALSVAWRAFPNRRLAVRVERAGDLALLPLDADFHVDSYRASRGRVSSEEQPRDGHVRAWGTTAQGVYKLGDTVQYKLYVRNQANRSLAPVSERAGYLLEVRDPTGKVVHEVHDLQLSEFGAYAGEFRVAATGAVGAYVFRLARGREEWYPLRTVVADFTPAPFRVRNTLNGARFAPGDTIAVATQATLHGGGPYAHAGTRVTARAYPESIEFANPRAAGFDFQSEQPVGHCEPRKREEMSVVHQSDGAVDERGELLTQFTLPDASIVYGRLEAESAVRDDRGKFVATRVQAEYRGRDRYVGLRSTRWMLEEGKPASVEFLVLDAQGAVVPEVPVTVSVAGQVTTAARIRGAGNAYLTHYENGWVEHTACAAASGSTPQECTFTPAAPGLYSIQASVRDAKGRTHTTELCTWVTGKGRVLWDEPEDMSLSLVPEKQGYKVGERARVLVRNPFPGARALVTIERYGVIKRWVQPLEGSAPVIEFPVEPDFLPGFYLSVLVMAPRAAAVPAAAAAGAGEDGVDLGRPTYRIGYLELPVSDPYKTLDVAVQSERGNYRPRERVTLDLRARAHAPGTKEPPVEFAVAVLDEAVFDLIPDGRKYFDPYAGLYHLDPLDVSNFDLLTRLVGLVKFEKKGANAGGDGGAGFDLRVVKNYVAYWNPSVRADAHGRARVDFQLPDNLTGWRVFALAVTPGDRLGLGEYKFTSSKLTELQPALPNQLTPGDRVTAAFSVLNRAPQARELTVTVSARGALAGAEVKTVKTLALAPFERASVELPLTADGEGAIRLTAQAGDAHDRDALEVTLPVRRRAALEVAATWGTTVKDEVTEPVAFPNHMLPSTGTLSVVLSPTVIGNLAGSIGYLRDYPYGCWEQRLSRAQAAAGYLRLRAYFPAEFAWPGAEAVPQAVLDQAASFQAPNGGMAFWVGEDARVSPYLSAATALAFHELKAAGYHVPGEVESRLQAYLERFLRERAAPTFYSDGMVSSVRAVALAALAAEGRLKRADLERYAEHVPDMDLFGQAAFLRAALAVEGADSLAAATTQRILAHADERAGKFQFTERWDDGWAQLLATPGRTQCAILTAFVAYGERAAGARLIGDVPFKLVRQITQARGDRDHWENTQENLYCLSALSAYSAVYEREPPQLSARASLGGEPLGEATFSAFRDPAATLTRANTADDPARRAPLRIERSGSGRLYYGARLSYALPDSLAQASNAGMEVTREYSVQRAGTWRLLAAPFTVARGELVRVDLYLSLPAARHFVVVDDPVPGGLEPVNRELATASTVDADAAEFQAAGGAFWFRYGDWSEYGVSFWNFYHRELRHEAVRFYADYLPAGHYHLSYAAQAIAPGQFAAAPVRAEEMYDPDVYGKGLPARLTVTGDARAQP